MKIKSLNKQYTGMSASVDFVNGVGETDSPALIDWFRTHGYEVEDPEKEAEITVEVEEVQDAVELEAEASEKPKSRKKEA